MKFRHDDKEDIIYIEVTEQEKNEKILKEDLKTKIKNGKFDALTRAEKDELLLTLAKLHDLI